MRSMLFVPGDRPDRFPKAVASGADAVILDLEDAVTSDRRGYAREAIAEYLRAPRAAVPLWVRINPVDSADVLADLAAVVPARPDGVILPKARHGGDVLRLDHWLEMLECEHGFAAGAIQAMPMITETAGALLSLGSFTPSPSRVSAMTWGAEDLATELGALGNRTAAGDYEPAFELARSLCLITAAAAAVRAIDTVDTEIRDIAAVEQRARQSRRAGYLGKLAIHPAQIPAIHAAFTPAAAELDWAQRVLAAVAAAPAAGAVKVDGKLIDRPHVLQAERLLAAVGQAGRR
ncbi:MAG: CoA ester lyase [Sinobacteraceae bacterium]|nr:CoA ester lyase [Nevskiaceae bacterium]